MMVAAPLFAVMAHAQNPQDNPTQNPGSTGDIPLSGYGDTGQSQVDCTDPLMAASSQCSGAQGGGALQSGGLTNRAPSGLYNPYSPNGRTTNYTDQNGLTANQRARSTMIPLAPEPLTEFQKFTASTTGMVLPIFGANLFQNVPSTFAPLDNSPVPPDYVLGPEDTLRLRVWGQVNLNANLVIDRAGNIFIPQVGAVHVAGVRFADLETVVRDAMSKIYRNFQLSVEIGQIRSIQVYITGEARRPGVYTVSSLSTLVDALFAGGGPSVQGSMRHIELRRGGATLVTFDLYRLLIDGDKSKDTKLLPGDVIFIPAVGPQAAVMGSVRRPAIYELLPGDSVGDAIKDAGNVTALASDARASLERSVDHNGRQAMEVRLDTAGMSTPMEDGDILNVIPLVSRFQKTVTLRGNTANPGRFAWHQGMRLSDLIPDRQSLITRDYWWKRASLGMPAPEFEPVPALSAMKQPTSPVDLPQQESLLRRQIRRASAAEANAPPSTGSTQSAAQTQNQAILNQDPAYYWNYATGTAPPDDTELTNDLAMPNSNQGANNQPSATGSSSDQGPPVMRGGDSALAEQDTENQERANPRPVRKNVVQLTAPEIDWSYAVIERMDPETLKTTLIPFDPGKAGLAARSIAGSRTAAGRHGHDLFAGRHSRSHRRPDHPGTPGGRVPSLRHVQRPARRDAPRPGEARGRTHAECVPLWLRLYPRIDAHHPAAPHG